MHLSIFLFVFIYFPSGPTSHALPLHPSILPAGLWNPEWLTATPPKAKSSRGVLGHVGSWVSTRADGNG